MKHYRLVLIIISLLSFNLYPQIISGTIKNPITQKGVPNLTVSIGDCTALTDANGFYKIQISPNMLISNFESSQLTFNLIQNYPNPFNKSTIITFIIPNSGHVDLTVYNLFGQKVNTLVHKIMNAGTHRIMWDATDNNGVALPSGLYIYYLKTSKYSVSKKLLVLK